MVVIFRSIGDNWKRTEKILKRHTNVFTLIHGFSNLMFLLSCHKMLDDKNEKKCTVLISLMDVLFIDKTVNR